MATSSLLILTAGPYRSGTGDDPQKVAHGRRVFHPLEDVPGCEDAAR